MNTAAHALLVIEAWVARQGARWFRLAADTGGRRNTLRVMLKPLGSETVAACLDPVSRDRPAPA